MNAFYDRLEKVHKTPLHEGQIRISKDYFVEQKRVIQSQWGRSGGKTSGALFVASVASALTPNFLTYIICPQLKQGKKIYWTSGRLPNYAPPKLIADMNVGDMCVTYGNGSKILVDGQENFSGLRGIKPNLVIYDEFQDHGKEFHLEVMQPNLIAKSSALMIFGTPPKSRDRYYNEFRDQLLKDIRRGSTDRSYYEFPSEINPTLDKAELARIRRQLIESGNEVIWLREYEGKSVFGGEDVVFPKWQPEIHKRPHAVVMSFLENDKKKLKWYTICDPGTSTCFAVMFVAYNPYTQQVFILDEIYERDRLRTDSKQIFERIRKKEQELYPQGVERDWKRYYDEAAAWFQREVAANFRIGLIPTRKQKTTQEAQISHIKMLMAQEGALIVSDRCHWLQWEIESFVTDESGAYPDVHNHLLDCFQYLMDACNWRLAERADFKLNVDLMKKEARPNDIPIDEWADRTVEDSLEIQPNDIYSEYFD